MSLLQQLAKRLGIKFLLAVLFLAAGSSEGKAESFKVAMPSTTHAVLAFTTARDKGYYRAEGLEAELILMSAPIASRALLSGDVAVATVGGAGLPPVLRGSPLKFLFTTYNRAMFWLYAKPEIRTVNALKGKRVGVSGIGSGPDSLLRVDAAAKRARPGPRRGDSQLRRHADNLCRAAERHGGCGDAVASGYAQGRGRRVS